MIYHLDQTTSTNDDARDAKYLHGDIIRAERQSAGRGQRGHSWTSAEGKNLLFSVVLEPTFLPVGEQFLLSEVVALALTDALSSYGITAKIKWTNDIYVGERKVVGILIEHHYAGSCLSRTIVGIGINVNQESFDPSLPNPASMKQLRAMDFDRDEVLVRVQTALMARYAQLEKGEKAALQADYRAQMYRLGEIHPFRYPDGTPTQAAIQGVKPSGELLLQHSDGQIRAYLFKEIEFVIDKG
ncbi:MAG: biotin--[acetyl-CoA-carboxylase] ligase [Alistipes sp.]